MNLTTKTLILLVAVATSFALGRYSVPPQPSTKTTTDSTTKKDQNSHTQTVITKLPDGTTKTIITKDTTIDTTIKKDVVQVEKAATRPTLSISGLAGFDFRADRMVYGAAITKEAVGPITIGLFGLTNGVVGASVGLNF